MQWAVMRLVAERELLAVGGSAVVDGVVESLASTAIHDRRHPGVDGLARPRAAEPRLIERDEAGDQIYHSAVAEHASDPPVVVRMRDRAIAARDDEEIAGFRGVVPEEDPGRALAALEHPRKSVIPSDFMLGSGPRGMI